MDIETAVADRNAAIKANSISKGNGIAFVHGRPGPHPFHGLLAKSIDADPVFVDYRMRWHDLDTSRAYRYLSTGVCSILFPSEYKLIVSEGPHTLPVLTRTLSVFGARPKAVALLDNETLYFLKSGFYRPAVRSALLKLIRSYDALVCVGDYQRDLAEELLNGNGERPSIFHVHSAISVERHGAFEGVKPDLESSNLLFIGNGPSGWRSHYKGLDILLDALMIAVEALPQIRLTVVGDWDREHTDELMRSRKEIEKHVTFVGPTNDLTGFLAESALYVHPARGEAFGISIIESMRAGVPCIVSDQTGAKEAVEKVSQQMVVPTEPSAVAKEILRYLELPMEERSKLSRTSRTVAGEYTEERAITEFRAAIDSIVTKS